MVRPLKILGPWVVTRICDSPDGARILADELDLSPGLVSTVKKECNDPIKRARRTGVLSPESILQTIPGMLQTATPLTGQVANIADTVMNGGTMTHDNREKTTSPYEGRFDGIDDEPDDLDYDLATVPYNYYTPTWVQPPSFTPSLLNPFDAVNYAMITKSNSQIAMKATEFAENLVHNWLPDHNSEVTRPQNTIVDKFKELAEKYLRKQEERAETESKDKDDPRQGSGNCSCAQGKQNSSTVVDPSDQIVSTIGTESDVIGSEVHGKPVVASKQSLDMTVTSNAGPVTAPETGSITEGNSITLPSGPAPPAGAPNDPGANIPPKEEKTGSTVVDEQNDSKNDPSGLQADNTKGVVVTVPPTPPPSLVGAVDTVRPNIPLDLPHKPPLLSTPPPVAQVKVEDIKPEFPQGVESEKQNSVGNGTIPGQLPPSDTSTNNVDKSFTPPPSTQKDEDQKSNGASTEQSNGLHIFQLAPVKSDDTFPQMQPGVNHNLRNGVLIALAIVGIGVAALYIYDPNVRQWIFSRYVRLFHKASPQGTSNHTFTQPQEIADAYTQGYARVNDPHGVALF